MALSKLFSELAKLRICHKKFLFKIFQIVLVVFDFSCLEFIQSYTYDSGSSWPFLVGPFVA
ncbi:MAG: hypothetical protein B7Y39_08155 [Bdellovibrio sp. 28-41-41]|nr:MAG: hypothetical protein B7Y39_08155 [Bdellovibrio sp. 28-41-41]